MFDILQFIPNNYKRSGYEGGYDNQTNKQFISFAIDIWEDYLSAYRFVDKLIT